MIPLKLKMRNFMCYQGEIPALDFTGIHTACISGDNGNGKSAIIDAMTWSLWGKSRAKKSDDDLISLGKEDMEVEFDFSVSGQVYRIIRKHSRPKRANASGQSILEFQIDQGYGFKALTGNSIGDTQQRIINVVHMDYETFINSALILQGRADEFTLRTPAKRAEVLSEILGFAYYDALAEDANNMARAAESQRGQLEKSIDEMIIEIAGREQAEADLEQTTRELAISTDAIESQAKKLEDLKRQKETLEAKEGELKTIDIHLNESRRVLSHLETEQSRHQSRIDEFDALTDRRLEIETGFRELAEMRKSDAEMSQKFRESVSVNDRRHKLEMRIESLKQKLVGQHNLSANKIAELEETIGKLPEIKREQQKSQAALEELDRLEKELTKKRQALDEIRTEQAGLNQTALQLKRRAREIEEKVALLKNGGELCPLCGSEIGETELNTILNNYTKEKANSLDDLKSNQINIATNQKELETEDKGVRGIEFRLNKERPGILSRAGIIEKSIADAVEAENTLAVERERLGDIEQQLARREFAATEEKILADIESDLKLLNYDETAHRTIQKRIAELEPYADLKRRLEESDRLAGAEKEAFISTGETIREMKAAIFAESNRRDGLARELFQLPQIQTDAAATENEHHTLIAKNDLIKDALSDIKAKVKHLVELEQKRTEKRAELARAAEEEKIYRDLTVAFGKKGIQQMFIEAAIPEIEVEANKLLSRMTDNRMHLKIDTLRQSRRGDAMETLDINISDELGQGATRCTPAARRSVLTSPSASPYRKYWRDAPGLLCRPLS